MTKLKSVCGNTHAPAVRKLRSVFRNTAALAVRKLKSVCINTHTQLHVHVHGIIVLDFCRAVCVVLAHAFTCKCYCVDERQLQ